MPCIAVSAMAITLSFPAAIRLASARRDAGVVAVRAAPFCRAAAFESVVVLGLIVRGFIGVAAMIFAAIRIRRWKDEG